MRTEKIANCGNSSRTVQDHVLFEFCSELGRQVGGIYTVLKSKAPYTKKEYGDRYTLVGPLVPQSASIEVEELKPPTPELSAAIEAMEKRGIATLYGRWLIEGSPRILLLDTEDAHEYLDEWKEDFARVANISLPLPDGDELINESILFGYLTAWFIEDFAKYETQRAIIAHFHEWPGGLALPLIKQRQVDVMTIFTAHATVLGRQLSRKGVDWYDMSESLDIEDAARKIDHYPWHCLEKAAAQSCHLFTTVSQITSQESEYFLQRKPDAVLPNGLNIGQMTSANEAETLRRTSSKRKLLDFVRCHFYGHLDFDLEETRFFFLAGRYEFRNKGADIYIDALAGLNKQLKSEGSSTTIVAFIIMPAKTTSILTETLKGKAVVKSLRDYLAEINRSIGDKLFEKSLQWKEGDTIPTKLELITEQDNLELQRHLLQMQRADLPPICTHNLADSDSDPILNRLKEVGLQNRPEDRVKVVFYPSFLNSSDPVLPMNYYEFIRGTHLGVFPSVYEPWGYTAAECVAMGIPSITSNVSGFGLYVKDLLGEQTSDYGVYIVDRRSQDYKNSVTQMTDFMHAFCEMTCRERTSQRHLTEDLGEVLDWEHLNVEYIKARRAALRLGHPEQMPVEEEASSDEDELWSPALGVWPGSRNPSPTSSSWASGLDRRSSSIFSTSPVRNSRRGSSVSSASPIWTPGLKMMSSGTTSPIMRWPHNPALHSRLARRTRGRKSPAIEPQSIANP